MKIKKLLLLMAWALLLQGCVLTKVVTVPMRLGGAVISVIPVVGNTIDDSIDTAADVVDEVPI
jgi:starvation-inducible outer membrane lipoprotein